MIPAFLKELAALIRHRIAAGQAVYVTEQTSQELELLAGLPWVTDSGHAVTWFPERKEEPSKIRIPDRQAARPDDLALGWLLASKVRVDNQDSPDGSWRNVAEEDDVKRAAVCAELAVLAGQVGRMPVVFVEPNDAMRQKYQDILRHFGGGAVSLMTEPVEFIPGGVFPHDGTREGARAAWAFICQEFERQTPPLGFPGNEQQLSRDARFREIRDTYRRELEAMK